MHLDLPTLSTQSPQSQVSRRAMVALAVLGILTLLAGFSPHALAASSPSPTPSASPSAGQSAAPGAKPGSAPVTFGIGPAATPGVVGLRSSFSFGVTPGAQATDKVTVFNYSLVPLELAVYAVQAQNTADGAIAFSAATAAPTDIAAWLAVGTTRPVMVSVPGRANASKPPGEVTMPIKLAVPLNAEPGDHVGGVVAALAVKSNDAKGEQVTLEQRVVTRVYVRVSGPLHPMLEIVGLHAAYHQGNKTAEPQPATGGYSFGAGSTTVTYTVHNVGNVRVQASQAVKVSGLIGSSKTVRPKDIAQLLPGGSSKVTVVVPGVWPTVLVRPNVRVVPSALTGDVDPELKPVSATTWTWAIPWPLVIVLVVLGVVLWLRRRRARLRRAPVVPAARAATTVSPVASGAVPAEASGRHRVEAVSGRKSRHGR